jgi:hypothetical protein
MDYRFRRHHCKHICAVLSQLGILDQPAGVSKLWGMADRWWLVVPGMCHSSGLAA